MKFDWNDLAMAFLGAIFVIFGVTLLADGLYHNEKPETAGYAIEGAPVEAAAAEEEEVVVEDASMMMADMDISQGENVAKKCAACHNFNEGGANKVGPILWDTVNRPIASVPDFGYSSALRDYAADGKVWDYAELNGFLYRPKDHVKGTSMGFAGLRKTDERAAIMAYMRSLSNNPAPLPEPADAATPVAEEAVVEPEEVSPEEVPATTGTEPAIAPTETDQGATSD